MYDLTTCKPHEPDDARYTAIEYQAYVDGYTLALVMALKVMEFAEERWHMHLRTKRLATKQKREQEP